MILYDFGVALGFVGLIMFVTGRALSKASITGKESSFYKRKCDSSYVIETGHALYLHHVHVRMEFGIYYLEFIIEDRICKHFFIVAILVLGFLITFQIAKASEYVAVLRGEEKARKQTNKINAFMLLAFLDSWPDRCVLLQ